MTKLRAPLTFDNALTRIAAVLGWEAMATVTGQRERTVRNWGDPDTGQRCPIDAAVMLDIAYAAAGGEGAPMFETYAQLVQDAYAARFADHAQIAERACDLIREGAQAEEALVRASIPGACSATRANARRQLEDVVLVAKSAIPLLADPEPPPDARIPAA